MRAFKPTLPIPFLLVALLFSVVFAGCGGNETTEQRQTIDGVTMAFQIATAPAINQTQEFRVRLTDAAGQPINNADVSFDLAMLADTMGVNRPVADARGDGTYTARSVFTMLGEWQITVLATIEGKAYSATFTTTVTE